MSALLFLWQNSINWTSFITTVSIALMTIIGARWWLKSKTAQVSICIEPSLPPPPHAEPSLHIAVEPSVHPAVVPSESTHSLDQPSIHPPVRHSSQPEPDPCYYLLLTPEGVAQAKRYGMYAVNQRALAELRPYFKPHPCVEKQLVRTSPTGKIKFWHVVPGDETPLSLFSSLSRRDWLGASDGELQYSQGSMSDGDDSAYATNSDGSQSAQSIHSDDSTQGWRGESLDAVKLLIIQAVQGSTPLTTGDTQVILERLRVHVDAQVDGEAFGVWGHSHDAMWRSIGRSLTLSERSPQTFYDLRQLTEISDLFSYVQVLATKPADIKFLLLGPGPSCSAELGSRSSGAP